MYSRLYKYYSRITSYAALLAGYNIQNGESAKSPKVDINPLGQAMIAWDHVMLMTDKEMHHLQVVTNF